MFEWLRNYDRILVTGPHRSGTRICSRMIAYDTGHTYVDENAIEMDSLYDLASRLRQFERLVVQCPSLCPYVHLVVKQPRKLRDKTAVVLMRRPIPDIIASQNRIRWSNEWLELARYGHSEGVISEIKYRYWEEHQKEQIDHAFEIEYASLAQHPLWISPEQRGQFWAIQTLPRDQIVLRKDVTAMAVNENGLFKLFSVRGLGKVLNDSGTLIWSLCDGQRTYQDILAQLKAEFADVDEALLVQDLDDFLRRMIENGLLTIASNSFTMD